MSGTPQRGYREKLLLQTESTYGVPVTATGTYGMEFTKNDVSATDEQVMTDAKRDSRSVRPTVKGRRTVAGPITLPLQPSGTAGTAPDCSPILATAFTVTTQSVEPTVGAGATTTVIPLSATTSLAANGLLPVPIVGYGHECRRIASVSAGVSVTVEQPFSIAPAETAAVGKCNKYSLTNDPTASVTLHRQFSEHHEMVSGAILGSLDLAFKAGQNAEATFNIMAADLAFLASGMTLASGIDDDDTTMTLDGADKAFAGGACTFLATIDSERILITAIDGTTATIARGQGGTTPASHLTGATITLYSPTYTPVGYPVLGTKGKAFIGAQEIELTDLSISADFGGTLQTEALGTRCASRRINANSRNITAALTGILKTGDGVPFGGFHGDTTYSFFAQIGTVKGRIICVYFPELQFETPKISAENEGEVPMALTGKAVITAVANADTEFVLWFA